MILRTFHVRFHPRDLGLECLDTSLQLLNRNGIEVLLCKGDERIVGLAREEVFQIHGRTVDP